MDRTQSFEPRNEFWLYINQLASAYSNEGLTPQERAESIAGWFLNMPSVVRPELLADLKLIVDNLPDLQALVTAGQHKIGSSKRNGDGIRRVNDMEGFPGTAVAERLKGSAASRLLERGKG